ncbi:MAG: hypothetical protein IT374_03130 [Polyangiaceae bacterium]|nr:hypothetical protein [Polyangiaceae bacterium]
MTPRDCYLAVWNAFAGRPFSDVSGRGLLVFYVSPGPCPSDVLSIGERGKFYPDGRIAIARGTLPRDPCEPDPAGALPDVASELAILAHEIGHFLCYLHGPSGYERHKGIVNAASPPRTRPRRAWARRAKSMRFIVEEERAAWEHASALLAQFAFTEWDAFERERHEALRGYESHLAELLGR